MVGARVIKTCLAICLSVLIAKSLNLYAYQFAGIVSILAVQPSIYRSIRAGIQQTASAIIGAIVGAIAMKIVGTSFLVMGIVAFVIMYLHVMLRWTNSLLVSAVVAINTLGSQGLSFLDAAINQLELVLIGMTIGTCLNLVHKPVHQKRAETILFQSEGMLRALLYFIALECKENKRIPFASVNQQINQVKAHIEEGLKVASLVNEDIKYQNVCHKNTFIMFRAFADMIERMRDMSKAIQDMDILSSAQIHYLTRSIFLVIHSEERAMHGKSAHTKWITQILERQRTSLWHWNDDDLDFQSKLAFYNFYSYLMDYVNSVETIQSKHIKGKWAKQPKINDLKSVWEQLNIQVSY